MKYKKLEEFIESSNTGLDAIQKAPIVKYDTGIKCIRIGDISQNNEYGKWGFSKVNEENYKKFALKKGDILIARTGNTIGVNKYINEDMNSVYNNGLIRLRVDKEKCNPLYIYYIIQQQSFKDFVNSIAFGTSTQPNMKIKDLLSYEIPCFDKNYQMKIVNILKEIDYKIKENTATNNNLLLED